MQSGGEASLPTHTAPSPCTSDVRTVETQHQRVDQACPGDYAALNIEGLDKNNAPDLALAGRLEHGDEKAGGEISLPTHGFELVH